MSDPEKTEAIPQRTHELMVDWFRRSRESQQVHYECSNHFGRLHYGLGIPTIVLSAIVGTAVFASLESELDGWWRVTVGTISIGAAVLASLQTFLGLSERAENHRLIAAQYASVRRDLELLKTFFEEERALREMAAIKARMDELAQSAPEVPGRIKRRIWRRLKERGHDRVFTLPPEKVDV